MPHLTRRALPAAAFLAAMLAGAAGAQTTTVRVLHVEQQGDHATAILYRRMSPDAPPAMYELRLRRDTDTWMVAGETVTPWPGGIDGNFLPPRRKRA